MSLIFIIIYIFSIIYKFLRLLLRKIKKKIIALNSRETHSIKRIFNQEWIFNEIFDFKLIQFSVYKAKLLIWQIMKQTLISFLGKLII